MTRNPSSSMAFGSQDARVANRVVLEDVDDHDAIGQGAVGIGAKQIAGTKRGRHAGVDAARRAVAALNENRSRTKSSSASQRSMRPTSIRQPSSSVQAIRSPGCKPARISSMPSTRMVGRAASSRSKWPSPPLIERHDQQDNGKGRDARDCGNDRREHRRRSPST